MRSSRRCPAITALIIGVLCAALVPGAALAAAETPLDPALCDPTQAGWTTDITNAHFPLLAGAVWVYTGKERGTSLGLRISVLGGTETFNFGHGDKVGTLRVEELEWEDANADGMIGDPADEPLIEISVNYFAQTADGTVCYFGEDVDIYEDGEVVSHEGAWRADDPGNAPGIFMPATPERGMTYQQEFAPGVAEDQATVTRTGLSVTAPAGAFTDVVRIADFNPLDNSRGTKDYAPGVGQIRDGPFDLISSTLVGQPADVGRAAGSGQSVVGADRQELGELVRQDEFVEQRRGIGPRELTRR
jgi:hypothetical protein